MPSASLSGRMTIGTGALAVGVLGPAGLAGSAQATVRHLAALQPGPSTTAHPTTGHPTTGHPTTGHPTTGHPTTGHPTTGHPTTGLPRVSSVLPTEGAPGWPVTLAGSRFRHVTSVAFNGVGASFTVTSSSRITATVPSGASTGQIIVTTKAGAGRSATFTVTPPQTLEPGETLPSTDALTSKDGHYRLDMQGNGNLVYFVTGTAHALWASGTTGHPGAYLTMLGNGNLVMYSASGDKTLWSSKTSGQGPARLVAQANGDLIVYQGSTPTWAAGSYDSRLEPGERLRPGWFLSSGNGYKLTMQKNGNLVEAGAPGTIWSSNTAGHAGATLVMRADGNLVIRHGSTLWASKTAAHPGAKLVDRRSGILAVRYQGRTLWASKKGSPPTSPPLTLGQWAGKAGPGAADADYGYPYPHPPACTHGGACAADRWAFYQGQCTSWVAYRLNQLNAIAFTNSYGGKGRWGNAVNWAAQARTLKISVNSTPEVGAVAWYASTKGAPDGHVAYVEKVNSPTSIVISEMNYDGNNGFWVHTITKNVSDWPTHFIHLADR
jgi:surface antigen